MTGLILVFATITQTFNLPDGLLSALCYVESGHDYQAVNINDGGSSSYGVCQIKLSTAQLLGFKGTEKSLRKPSTNIYYAGKYLRSQLNRYDNDITKAVAAYNAGTYKVNKRGLTRNIKYVNKVLLAWSENR